MARGLAVYEKSLGPGHPMVGAVLTNLANLYVGDGNLDKAEPLFQRANAILQGSLGPEHPRTALSLSGLATVYFISGQLSKAEPLYLRAIAILGRQADPANPNLVMALTNLGGLYTEARRFAQAEALYQDLVLVLEETFGPDSPRRRRRPQLSRSFVLLHEPIRKGGAHLSTRAGSLGEYARPRRFERGLGSPQSCADVQRSRKSKRSRGIVPPLCCHQ